ncbi:uncharacterized protein LOC127850356 [Dreissena polymorpha]|uniref:uncharacterized protein LOC127850356 n=1 Tax=Dreissena polymorpha TaxID=45954 RepID=UPI002264B366|nr:uncharacterized protein LOC127850356 [Dreissena polymorpha]XP_052239292.1 uncharacterized protein LOC127850356 [Dreissena polymorpha]
MTSQASKTGLFADDTLLYRRIKTAQDAVTLQSDLDSLQKWEKDWQLSFNPSKCEVIHISKKRHPIKSEYLIHGQKLAPVKEGKYLGVTISENLSWKPHIAAVTRKAKHSLGFLRGNLSSCPLSVKEVPVKEGKYLGVTISENLSWKPHIAAVTRKANNSLGFLRGNLSSCPLSVKEVPVKEGRYLGVTISENLSWKPHIAAVTRKANNSLGFLRGNLSSCPLSVKERTYSTLVCPILEYAATAWDPYTQTYIDQLEAVQRRAARFVKGDYRTTSSSSQMIADIGWQPLQARRQTSKVTMMYRIINNLIDIPSDPYLRPAISSSRDSSIRYIVPYCRTD